MSFYITLEGTLSTEDKKLFNKAVESLKKWNYIDEDGNWLDEADQIMNNDGETVVDSENLIIRIPYGCHRSLFQSIDSLEKMGMKAEYIGYSTDGVFEGYVNDEVVDLEVWAKKRKSHFGKKPKNFDALCDWQEKVGESFMSNTNFRGSR